MKEKTSLYRLNIVSSLEIKADLLVKVHGCMFGTPVSFICYTENLLPSPGDQRSMLGFLLTHFILTYSKCWEEFWKTAWKFYRLYYPTGECPQGQAKTMKTTNKQQIHSQSIYSQVEIHLQTVSCSILTGMFRNQGRKLSASAQMLGSYCWEPCIARPRLLLWDCSGDFFPHGKHLHICNLYSDLFMWRKTKKIWHNESGS